MPVTAARASGKLAFAPSSDSSPPTFVQNLVSRESEVELQQRHEHKTASVIKTVGWASVRE